MIGDISAFAASIYMRGIRLTLLPTTLLAMVDASIGGKTGIDFGGAKNSVGTFYPAEEVLMCLSVLDTLPEREFRTGLVEGIKHALLDDAELFASFQSRREAIFERDVDLIKRIVATSLRVKGTIVESDPKETGIRAHLNLGHTFGHALEAATGFRTVTHGEAVAWGIGKAMKLGLALNLTDHTYAKDVWRLLDDYGYPIRGVDFGVDSLITVMKADKKKKAGKLRFVIQERLGKTRLVNASDRIIDEVLSDDSAIE